MAALDNEKRWKLVHVSIKDECIIVLDKLAKKRRVYHVPQLLHAELVDQKVNVYTSTSKIMQLDLLTATRRFLSAEQHIKLMQAKEDLLNKKTVSKKPKQILTNILNLTRPRFADTVSY